MRPRQARRVKEDTARPLSKGGYRPRKRGHARSIARHREHALGIAGLSRQKSIDRALARMLARSREAPLSSIVAPMAQTAPPRNDEPATAIESAERDRALNT